MPVKNTEQQYGTLAKFFHWALAFIFIHLFHSFDIPDEQ